MFPSSALQKAEEDYLVAADAYCDERLVRRLDDGAQAARRLEGGAVPHEDVAVLAHLEAAHAVVDLEHLRGVDGQGGEG